MLARADPSPVIEPNRAMSVAMRDGPVAGLGLMTPSWRAAIWGATTWRTRRDPEIIATADIGCYAYLRRETHVPVVRGAEHLV